MAIQMRRGLRADFDPYKMLPGEWAVSIDPSTSNQIVWMCFEPGVCKRMGTYEDFAEQVKEATADVKTEYVEEFDKILDEIKVLSSQVSDDKDAVVSIKTTIEDEYLPQIQEALLEIQEKVSEAKNSADASAVSAENAKKSEVNAKNSETEAKTSETNAATSENNAKTSETNAATSATTATTKATDAANYASNAETSALTATNKAIEASQYAEEAAESAKQSQISADAAAVSETNAKTSETNAKTYAEQAKEVGAVEVMTEENNGIGKPDGDTITVDENGTFKAIKAEQDGNGKVISDTYILRESILNSQEEIEANTSGENVAGALALKEINNNMGGLRFGVDADGNYGYYKDGADTVTPFKSGGKISVDAISMLLSGSISTTTTVSFTGLKSITFKMWSSGTVTVTYDDGTTKDITVNIGSTGAKKKTIDVVGANKIAIRTQSSVTASINIIDYE